MGKPKVWPPVQRWTMNKALQEFSDLYQKGMSVGYQLGMTGALMDSKSRGEQDLELIAIPRAENSRVDWLRVKLEEAFNEEGTESRITSGLLWTYRQASVEVIVVLHKEDDLD